MTNIQGLELLFIALGLFGLSIVTAMILLFSIWYFSNRHERGKLRSVRIISIFSGFGILLSVISWGYALLFVTPAGIIVRLVDLNPVLIVLLIGYSVPGILGGVMLLRKRG